MALESPMGFNGLTLNDHSWRDYSRGDWWIRLTSVDGLWDSDIRDERQVLPGEDGEVSSSLYYGGKSITLTGEVVARNLTGLRQGQRALQLAFGDLDEHQLLYRLWGESPVYISAKKTQPIAMAEAQTDNRYARGFTVGLRADDPRSYSVATHTASYGSTGVTGTGTRRGYPRSYPIRLATRRRAYTLTGG
jgi:hypothetical protein